MILLIESTLFFFPAPTLHLTLFCSAWKTWKNFAFQLAFFQSTFQICWRWVSIQLQFMWWCSGGSTHLPLIWTCCKIQKKTQIFFSSTKAPTCTSKSIYFKTCQNVNMSFAHIFPVSTLLFNFQNYVKSVKYKNM